MQKRKTRFVICVSADGYAASLEPRKVYRVVDDPAAEARSLLRVVDESEEDYLFPAHLFVPIEVPDEAAGAFASETPTTR